MIFRELTAFTNRVLEILSEDELVNLERALILNPEIGDVIPGAKGLRKVRIGSGGKGKRGGSRVIYYWYVEPEKIALCRIYSKSDQTNVSPSEIKRILKELDL